MDCITRSVENMVATRCDELVSVDHLLQPLICCFRFFRHNSVDWEGNLTLFLCIINKAGVRVWRREQMMKRGENASVVC